MKDFAWAQLNLFGWRGAGSSAAGSNLQERGRTPATAMSSRTGLRIAGQH
jgi:hypothetical protein